MTEQQQTADQATTSETEPTRHVRLKAKHDLSAFAELEESRYAMSVVRYDAERNEFVATNARVLAIAKNDGDERSPISFSIPANPLIAIGRAFGKRWPRGGVKAEAIEDDCVAIRDGEAKLGKITAKIPEGRFPDYSKVLELAEAKPQSRVMLDARYLRDICDQAIRAADGMCDVTLSIAVRGPESPVDINVRSESRPIGLRFLVMPRVDD